MTTALILAPSWSLVKPPISLALLTASLRNKGRNVLVLDLNNRFSKECRGEYKDKWSQENDMYWKDPLFVRGFVDKHRKLIDGYVERILDSGAGLIGFSVYYPNQLMSLELAGLIKARDKERLVVFGGPQCALEVAGNDILKKEQVDAIVVTEGDEVIIELDSMAAEGGGFRKCPGVLFKKDGMICDGGRRPPIMDLDPLPFADFSDLAPGEYLHPEELPILSSRGCVWQCRFCTARIPWVSYRGQSGERVFREIWFQTQRFPAVDTFSFHDCMINGNIPELEKLSGLIIDKKAEGKLLSLNWWCQGIIRPHMSGELLRKMKQAGCRQITYGVESGSERVIRLMGKSFDASLAHKVIKDTHEAGIKVTAIFMLGFPGEERDDFYKTMDFIKDSRDYIDEVIPAEGFCVIERNSSLYKNAADFGLFLDPHPFFWKTRDGRNTYVERFNRFEEFCGRAEALGMKLGGSYEKNRIHKDAMLKEYNDCCSGVSFNICAGSVNKGGVDAVKFFWELCLDCRLGCVYCVSRKRTPEHAVSDGEWKDIWKRIHGVYGNVEIEVAGGDPLAHPGFCGLAKEISSRHSLLINTNFSSPVTTDVLSLDPEMVRFKLNLHPSRVDVNDFIKGALLLKENGFLCRVYCLGHPSHLERIPEISGRVTGSGLSLVISAFWGEFEGKKYPDGYSAEELNLLEPFLGDERRIRYNLDGEPPEGKLCNAGYRKAVVRADGDVSRCEYCAGVSMGNIRDEGFRLWERPLPCKSKFCPYNEFDTVR